MCAAATQIKLTETVTRNPSLSIYYPPVLAPILQQSVLSSVSNTDVSVVNQSSDRSNSQQSLGQFPTIIATTHQTNSHPTIYDGRPAIIKQPRKGILKRGDHGFDQSSINFDTSSLLPPTPVFLAHTSDNQLNRGGKKPSARAVTFCVAPSSSRRLNFSESASSSSCGKSEVFSQPLEVEEKPDNFYRHKKSCRKSRKKISRKTRRNRFFKYYNRMARVKTLPGPLSISLYIFLGALTVVAAVMFGMAELRAIQNRVNILPLRQNYIPVSCEVLSENEGKLIHIDCPLHKLCNFRAPSDFAWNLKPFRGVFLEMKVEMYQWVLQSKTFGFYFGGEWSQNLVDSTNYPFVFYNSHVNPDFFPNINGAGRSFAREIYGGDFRLSRKHLVEFHSKKQLELVDDHYYTPPTERPPTSVSYTNTQLFNNALYTGNPLAPKIGDLRISFWGSTATHVSGIAQQKYNHKDAVTDLVSFFSDIPTNQSLYHSFLLGRIIEKQHKKHTVEELVYEGDFTPDKMFQKYLAKRDGPVLVIWSIRLVFAALLTALVAFTYRIMDTFTKVALLPVVGGSAVIAPGLMFFICAPLWLLCDAKVSAAFAVSGLALVLCGAIIWSCGSKFTSQFLSDEDADGVELLGNRDTSFLRHDGTKHFYQPV